MSVHQRISLQVKNQSVTMYVYAHTCVEPRGYCNVEFAVEIAELSF